MMTHQFEKYLQLGEKTYFNRLGKVVKIVGLTIESVGPDAKLNDLCLSLVDIKGNILYCLRNTEGLAKIFYL